VEETKRTQLPSTIRDTKLTLSKPTSFESIKEKPDYLHEESKVKLEP
jgi:hypothetical protein